MKTKKLPLLLQRIMSVSLVVLVVGALVVAPAAAWADILTDFEGGVPAGWFTFFGSSTVNTTTQTVADTDALARPGQNGDNEILANDFNVTDFGGFGQDLVTALGGPQDWSRFESFNFWFYGTGSGLAYQAEISDNRSDPALDTSERFDYVFTDSLVGWQFISIPFADFTRATDFQPGGAPDDGFTLTEIWAWAIVLPLGTDTVYFDDLSVGQRIVDDFENGLPRGTDGDGISIGFYTFQGAGSSITLSDASTPPAPLLPEVGSPNNVLQVDVESTSFAGFIHGFENDTVDTWVSQDWSAFNGFALWLYGNNSGSDLFIDLLENRNPGSTTDDAERWTVAFTDDFSGWQYFEFPFNDFTRKSIGNGAPNDGLTLEEVYGWAFGTLGTGGPRVYYIDNVSLYGIAEIPELAVTFSAPEYEVTEGTEAAITVKLTRELGAAEDDPAQVSVDYSSEPGTAIADRDYTPVNGTLTFTQGGPTELIVSIPTFDNPKHDGDKTAILRLSDPVDVASGFTMQAVLAILDDDPLDSTLLDDFELGAYLFDGTGGVQISTMEVAADDPLNLPGQGDYENILKIVDPVEVELLVQEPLKCHKGRGLVPIAILTTDSFDAITVDHATVTFNGVGERQINKRTGEPIRREVDVDGDGDLDLLFLFRLTDMGPECDDIQGTLQGQTYNGQLITSDQDTPRFGRDLALGQNWSVADGIRFSYYGQNTGDSVKILFKDNRAPDPGPSGWSLVWSDEFNEPAGTPPNPANWTYELGDGSANRIPGWGNDELQYYTDSTENSATNGKGHLVITTAEADGALPCYYGPCEFTSARLISWHKAEFAYGRIEARVFLPQGAGLWPAFWALGIDIGEVGWPQTGEIDIMEFVGREPFEVFGTIHGPGYAGGASFGDIYTFSKPVYLVPHTFTVEWGPDEIHWYVDDINYHNATPADVAPNEWVYNHPFFIIFNQAVGGNFGGPVGEDTTFPQTMMVDYVRVYQGPDTAERFETSFSDDFSGWQLIEVPFDSFARSADQPDGAPDDGLGLTEVWGYGFELPDDNHGTVYLDQVQLMQPSEVTVSNTNDSGPGSLRQAIDVIAGGGTIDFEPSLVGGIINLTSGPLVVSGKVVTIDGSSVPGLIVSGGGVDRVMIIDPGATADISYLSFTDGYGWQLGGGILNNGTLTLNHATVANNTMATDAGDFWQGGGGIYNGDGATLTLLASTVANNTAGWSGGGVYSFFNTTTTIISSTISGNVSNDVGGGIRLLGNAEIINSTLSGNESTGWYGGALFLTDGVLNMTNSTVAENLSPAGGPAAIFVGTFGDGSATLNLANSLVANNVTEGCFLAPFGAGPVAINSLGNNVFTDGTCFPAGSDQVVSDAGLGLLADNGGPTLTHALLAGSPAIDAGNTALCPATDQRGVARDAVCDVGSYEFVP